MTQIFAWRNDFSDFKQTVRLDNVLYTIRARWNTSREYWTLDIFDSSGLPIIYGQKIVLNTEIIRRYNDPRLPAGQIYPIDITNMNDVYPDGTVIARIGREDIGSTVFLVYEPAS